jgi:hypothetical protein
MGRPTGTALAAAALVGGIAAAALDRWAPAPSADVAHGTEDAFAKGLQRRELPPRQAPLRWTTDRPTFTFTNLPAGEAELEVAAAGHRGSILVATDGVVVGVLPVGSASARFPLPDTGRRSRNVQLEVPVFAAGDGRLLGARLQRVTITPRDHGAPSLALIALVAVPAVLAAAVGTWMGLPALAAAAFAVVVTALQSALLWPSGLARSPYAARLAVLVAAGLALAAVFGWLVERRHAGAGRWALIAMTAAWFVQWIVATSPVMVVSDAVFHANNLARVANGDFFPTSVTQHAVPFRFPYGVSFYAALAPLLRAGIDGVALVRGGAAAAGVMASAALFVVVLRPYGAAAAGLAVVLLQTLPATFDVGYSYGNLSNAFGQAATVGFFAWWARPRATLWPIGALLLAVAATAHFSSLVVSVALAGALAIARRGGLDRSRALALAVGIGLAVSYYVPHVPLVVSQLPRLLEGGGPGGAESPGILVAARNQLRGAVIAWGAAAVILAWFGRPRLRRADDEARALDRDLAAWWIGCGILALPAIVSPLEVRYLYALAVPVAVAAGRGAVHLYRPGPPRQDFAFGLVAAQLWIGGSNIAQALLSRYRP